MLIMPFIFDSDSLFSASKALDISSSDASMLSIFPRALSNSFVIYRQPSSSILWLKNSNWLLFYYKYLISTLVSNYPFTGWRAQVSPFWVEEKIKVRDCVRESLACILPRSTPKGWCLSSLGTLGISVCGTGEGTRPHPQHCGLVLNLTTSLISCLSYCVLKP